MRISAQMLTNLRFHLTHDCVPYKSRAKFQPSPRGNTGLVRSQEAMVYVWLVEKGEEFHVLYVGKAGG